MSHLAPSNPLSYLGVVAPNPPNVILATRDPVSGVAGQDATYSIGTEWSNSTTGTFWILTALVALTPTWTEVAGASGDGPILEINGLGPDDGEFEISGTDNQIDITPGDSEITLSLDAAVIAPGSLTTTTTLAAGTTLTAGTTITATLGAITATNGNLVLGHAGNKILITTGTNASAGTTAAMTSGSIVVSTSAVTANSLIFMTANTLGTVTAPSAFYVSARTAGTSFTITASQATDTSTVNWFLIN